MKEQMFSLLYKTGSFNTTTTMKDCTTDKSLLLEIFISCGKPMLIPKNIENFENQHCYSVVLWFCLPKSMLHVMGPCSPEDTCLPMGSSETIPCFALLECLAFAFSVKLPLSQPISFLPFTIPILSPVLLMKVREQLCGACLLPGGKPRHAFLVCFDNSHQIWSISKSNQCCCIKFLMWCKAFIF